MKKLLTFFTYLTILMFVQCVAANDDNETISEDKLNVTIYYESLGGDSIYFFRNHLFPSMILKKRLMNTNLNLIPYGKVENNNDTDSNGTGLNCHHGEEECEFNALHACIIENNNITDALLIITCLLNKYKWGDIDKCASVYQVNVDEAKECKENRGTAEILEKYGEATSQIDLKFVPSIQMGDTYDPLLQFRYRYSFDFMFCREFSKEFSYPLETC